MHFANDWLKRLIDADPRTVLQIAAAIAWLKRVVTATGGGTMHAIPTHAESRQLAGFSKAEVDEVARLERVQAGPPAHEPESPRDS